MKLDEQLSKAFADAVTRTAPGKKIADMCASQLLWLLFGAFAIILWVAQSLAGIGAVAVLAAAIVSSWLVTLALEYAIGRQRPFQREGKKLGIGMLWVPPSFPSGHATMAFSIVTAIAHVQQGVLPVGLPNLVAPALAVAALVALGRVAVRVHYFGDVLAGAVVGYVVTSLLILTV